MRFWHDLSLLIIYGQRWDSELTHDHVVMSYVDYTFICCTYTMLADF